MKKLILISLLFVFSVEAALIPKKENADSRITVIKYSPDNVIRVRVAIGINTLIQFEKGETFNQASAGVGIGDASAWAVDLKGNNIFLKPIGKKPDTNLTMISSKGRTYFFELRTSNLPHYVVKLQYEKVKNANDYINDSPCMDGKLNFRYGKWGDNDLAPSYMWDDGRFTCLKFSRNGELPVIYQVSTDGSESLVNYAMRKDTLVVHSVSKEFRLRLGSQVLGLRSENTLSSGYNEKASSIKAKRELSDE
jgi:type IV secretion system protein VirB9